MSPRQALIARLADLPDDEVALLARIADLLPVERLRARLAAHVVRETGGKTFPAPPQGPDWIDAAVLGALDAIRRRGR